MKTHLLAKGLFTLGLSLVAGVALAVFATGPTWTSVVVLLAQFAGSFLIGLPVGRITASTAERPPRMSLFVVLTAAPGELLRVALVIWTGLTAIEAAWASLLSQVLLWIPLLIFAVPRRITTTDEPQGLPQGPGNLVAAAGSFANDLALWLLVAWHPLLALLTFGVQAGVGVLRLRSPDNRRLRTVAGFLLLALALALWLL